jgi:hypothetical protein
MGGSGGWRLSLLTIRCAAAILAGFGAGWPGESIAVIVETALEQATVLRAEGRFDQALDALRAESRKVKAAEGEDSPNLFPINDLAAEILIDKGDLATAATLLEKTISAHEQILAAKGDDTAPALGRSLSTLARLETTAKRLPAALAAGRRALLILDGSSVRDEEAVAKARATLQAATNLLDDLVGPGSDAAITARDDVASLLSSLGAVPEAIEQRRKILAALMQNPAVDARAVLQATDRLGRLMMMNGRAAEAIPVVEMTLPAIKPPDSGDALAVRRLLADLQLAAGKLSLAEASCAGVLDATQAEAKPSAVVLATDRLRSLLVAVRRRAVDRLPDWFDTTAKSVARPSAAEAPLAISALVLAATVKEELGDPAGAAELLGRALALASSAKPPDASLVAVLSGRLAASQIAAGDVASASKIVETALPAAERDVGPGSAQAGFLRLLLADAMVHKGETTEAVALATKALDRGLPRPDDPWETRATAICDRLAAAEHEEGEKEGEEQKAGLRDRYIQRRAEQFGAKHAHVASACGLFGAARLAAGDGPAAIDFFQRAAEIDSDGASPETAANLVLLARAQQAAGEPTRGVETAVRGLAAWERLAGAEHPGSLAAAEVLVAAKLQAGDLDGVVKLLERLCASDAVDDPVRKAGHVARLAEITAADDKARAQDLLQRALQLPCWQEGFARSPGVSLRLAFTAALMAHAFNVVGDADAATRMLQRARGLVMHAEDSAKLLDRIERVATHGDRP